jgi:hypothetical protein
MKIDEYSQKLSGTLRTDGEGLWSDEVRNVVLTGMELSSWDEGNGDKWGELRVVFDEDSWDVEEHGLIYTDEVFLRGLRELLSGLGYNTSHIYYSEQGMQGDNYVSLDVETDFIDSFIAKVTAENS